MNRAAAVYMVYREEFSVDLSATSANRTAIDLESISFKSLPVLSTLILAFNLMCKKPSITFSFMIFPINLAISFTLFFMSMIVRSGVHSLLFRVFVGHKNAASHQLIAVTRQAGDRQLEVSVP